ncbi:MAG: protein kinase [Burkholderiales bacterium]|nr:protein kinase [Burkholderiales bacterium]
MIAQRPLRERIGKYPVKRRIGEGATSEVYLCDDPFNRREVAVKLVFSDAFNDPERGKTIRKLFVTEASLAGKLQHPHICEIYDAVSEDDQHYIVMEYVDGGTLQQFCRADNLLAIDRVVEIAFKCSRALEFAQRMGITHRDIKPANILHTGETDVKITDFGAALLSVAETTQVTAIGSPAYMSPEQVKEQPLTHQTDIYSLGVVMFHLLTGRLPFQATNNFSLIYQITNAEAPLPSTLRPGIPKAIDDVVRRAMAKNLVERYAQWGEFSRDLADVSREEPVTRTQAFSDSDKFETLRKLPFFENFSDAELWEVARISSWRAARAGEQLMHEGEVGTHFCLLAEGQVQVSKKGKLLTILRPGEPFGEMAYLSKTARTRVADVTVASDAKIITVPTARLAQATEGCQHKFDRAFMDILVERLSMANLRMSGV